MPSQKTAKRIDDYERIIAELRQEKKRLLYELSCLKGKFAACSYIADLLSPPQKQKLSINPKIISKDGKIIYVDFRGGRQ